MKSAAKFSLILVTAPNLKSARKIAQTAIHARLIACANLIPRVESHYRWQDNIARSNEVLLLMKTRDAHLAKLESLILKSHPYDVPEFITVKAAKASADYLAWLADTTAKPR